MNRSRSRLQTAAAQNKITAPGLPGLRRNLIASAVAAATFAGVPAFAQTADDQGDDDQAVLEELVVTGFRRSLENAIDNKRDAGTIIESISAEDIGRLPDISVADSIARLPGVTAQRTGGQAGAINIRGLDQGLVLSTLNGREQVATSGGRAIDFSQYPSELISGVDVYKGSEAKLIEGGLGGTVALKLARPLSQSLDKQHNLNLNLRASYNDLAGDSVDSDDYGYRGSFTYRGLFADETFGVVLGYARLQQANVASRFGTDTFTQTGSDFDGNGVNDFVPFRYGAEELGGEDTRDAYIASFQWQPNDDFELTFDSYYSQFDSTGFARGVTVIGPQSIGGGTTLTNARVSNDVIIGGTYTRDAGSPITDPNNPFSTGACCGGFAITPSSDTQTRDFDNEILNLGLGAKWYRGPWTFSGDLSYSDSDAFQPDTRVVIHQVNNGFQLNSDVQFDFLLNGLDVPQTFTLGNNFGDDPSQPYVGVYQSFPTQNDDTLDAAAFDVKYDFERVSGITSVEVGVRRSSRETSQERTGFAVGNEAGFYQFARNNADSPEANPNPFVNDIPGFSPVFVDPSFYSVEQFNGDFSGYPNYLAIDFDAVTGLFPGLTPSQLAGRAAAIAGGNLDFLITESFLVEEDTTAAYAQANYDVELFGIPVRGNFGIRAIDTEQSSDSNTILNGSPVPISIDYDYDDILPSFNAAFQLTDNHQLRLGLSKVIARPDLDDLRAGNSVNVDANTGIVNGNGGNTNLDPFEANQVDLSFEYYTDDGGIYTVAVFYKDLKTFIISQTLEQDFVAQGFIDPNNVNLNPGVTLNPIGEFTSPANGDGGFVRGIEFAFTQSFDELLPEPFNGLGVTANYSYTESSIALPDTQSGRGGNITLPGLSENVFNATVFYQNGGFETRLGYRYRDEFISRQRGIGEQLPINDEESVFDFQASYDFYEGGNLAGLTLLFQVNNLTDEPVVTYFSQPEQVSSNAFFGRQMFVGLSYAY
ncbi:MAG: TonB-dependent receptor [Pseudomonadota bacterium]